MMAFKQQLMGISAAALAATVAACGANTGAAQSGAPASPTAVASATVAAATLPPGLPTAVVPATMPPGLPTALSDPGCGEVPATVAGKWQKTIKPEDLPPELFDSDTGVFVMTLGPGHHVRTDVDSDHPGDDEDFCWTADRVVYVTDRDELACTGDSIGAYEWIVSDDSLVFTTIKDDCFWRPFFTVFETWTRLPS
jgi:hypothetical protein